VFPAVNTKLLFGAEQKMTQKCCNISRVSSQRILFYLYLKMGMNPLKQILLFKQSFPLRRKGRGTEPPSGSYFLPFS
jgi:hypothetical protein